jgi:hypothetical protein
VPDKRGPVQAIRGGSPVSDDRRPIAQSRPSRRPKSGAVVTASVQPREGEAVPGRLEACGADRGGRVGGSRRQWPGLRGPRGHHRPVDASPGLVALLLTRMKYYDSCSSSAKSGVLPGGTEDDRAPD